MATCENDAAEASSQEGEDLEAAQEYQGDM